MLWFALLVCFALVPLPAWSADEASSTETIEEDTSSLRAPATVMDHTLEVIVDGGNRLKITQRWQIRIDDPAGCAAGIPTPNGLDGASDGGARVLGDLLLVPATVSKGTLITLEKKSTERRGPYSGVFTTAPDLPLEQAKVVVQGPTWVPLTVWSDAEGVPSYSRRSGNRRTEITWGARPSGEPAEVVWTTWKDWDEAGGKLKKTVDRLMADKKALGRDIAADLEGLTPAGITERVNRLVTVYPGNYGDWVDAKKAVDVFAEGEGSAADRGSAIIALLRAAGHDAQPGAYRPADAATNAPLTVPAPAQLTRPAVAVFTDKGTIWIDPAASHTAVPDVPASMTGAIAWAPGQLPVRLAAQGSMDGLIAINSRITFSDDGAATWSASIVASDAAQEWLRTLLAPLDEDGRTKAMLQLAQQARPGSERVTTTMSSVRNIEKPLKITVQGHEPGAIAGMGPGARAKVTPVLAPAMAAWLPATRILIHEELSVEAPPGLQPLAIISPEPTHHAAVTLSRSIRREGSRAVLVTEVQRPDRTNSPQRAAEASRYLAAAATIGPELLLFGTPNPSLVKKVRAIADGRTAAEVAATEVLIWISADDQKRAGKTIKKTLKSVSADDLADAIQRFGGADDPRPWLAFYDAAPKDEAAMLVAVHGMAAAGATEDGWLRAAELLALTEDWAIKRELLLAITQLQPAERPDADAQAAAYHRWIEPEPLLARLEEASRQAWGEAKGPDRDLLLFKARYFIDTEQYADAQMLTTELLARGLDPEAMVLHAEASAHVETAAEDVLAEIDLAVALAPFDAEVLGAAARSMSVAGEPGRAQEFALSAARLAFTDPTLWADVAEYALRAGDLPTAAYAARRASDLDTSDAAHAERLERTATLIGDEDGATLGATRQGRPLGVSSWPPSLDELLDQVAWDHLLAVLQFHEHEVVKSERLLALRAQLRLDANLLDGAARDGVILYQKHGNPRGAALSFAATAGRLWSSAAVDALTTHRSHAEVRATRMDYYLITANGDASSDARILRDDDPRAALVSKSASHPADVAATLSGWPTEMSDTKLKRPSGWVDNRILGGPKGVVAWSHKDLGTTILIVDQVVDLALPPPLGLLYSAHVPDLATLPDRTRVLRLDGGNTPLFAAVNLRGDRLVYGIGFTPQAAKRAYWKGAESIEP